MSQPTQNKGNVLAALINKRVKVEPVSSTVKSTVTNHKHDTKEELKHETKDHEKKFFIETPPKIWASYSGTINLGDFESGKIEIGISMPVGTSLSNQEIEDAYNDLRSKLAPLVAKEMKEMLDYREDKKNKNGK